MQQSPTLTTEEIQEKAKVMKMAPYFLGCALGTLSGGIIIVTKAADDSSGVKVGVLLASSIAGTILSGLYQMHKEIIDSTLDSCASRTGLKWLYNNCSNPFSSESSSTTHSSDSHINYTI